MLELSQAVDLNRLPELICGFHRRADDGPTLYPVACAPQAWAAGAVYMLLQSSFGLCIDASKSRVTLRRAHLPPGVDWLELSNLQIGSAAISLRLQRHTDDVGVTVLRRKGEIEVVAIK
jgi:glycogen debranching enzyme